MNFGIHDDFGKEDALISYTKLAISNISKKYNIKFKKAEINKIIISVLVRYRAGMEGYNDYMLDYQMDAYKNNNYGQHNDSFYMFRITSILADAIFLKYEFKDENKYPEIHKDIKRGLNEISKLISLLKLRRNSQVPDTLFEIYDNDDTES